jgi:hypothetical protein
MVYFYYVTVVQKSCPWIEDLWINKYHSNRLTMLRPTYGIIHTYIHIHESGQLSGVALGYGLDDRGFECH